MCIQAFNANDFDEDNLKCEDYDQMLKDGRSYSYGYMTDD